MQISGSVVPSQLLESWLNPARDAVVGAVLGNFALRIPTANQPQLDAFAESFNARVMCLEIIEKLIAMQSPVADRTFDILVDSLNSSDFALASLSDQLLRFELGERSRMPMEDAYKAAYGDCPPTIIHYPSEDARNAHSEEWRGVVQDRWGLQLSEFRGARLLDVGCGSCEKAAIYSDLGAKVTGVDMTPEVLEAAQASIGTRPIRLLQKSLFDLDDDDGIFDIVVSDGCLHCANDTRAAYASICARLAPGGRIAVSLINVWGTLWWFEYARILTKFLAGADYRARAEWGTALFSVLRGGHEKTESSGGAHRSTPSWAYDWFAAPHWNMHKPAEVLSWFSDFNLEYVKSHPGLKQEDFIDKRNVTGVFGSERWSKASHLYWLANREYSGFYFTGRRAAS